MTNKEYNNLQITYSWLITWCPCRPCWSAEQTLEWAASCTTWRSWRLSLYTLSYHTAPQLMTVSLYWAYSGRSLGSNRCIIHRMMYPTLIEPKAPTWYLSSFSIFVHVLRFKIYTRKQLTSMTLYTVYNIYCYLPRESHREAFRWADQFPEYLDVPDINFNNKLSFRRLWQLLYVKMPFWLLIEVRIYILCKNIH